MSHCPGLPPKQSSCTHILICMDLLDWLPVLQLAPLPPLPFHRVTSEFLNTQIGPYFFLFKNPLSLLFALEVCPRLLILPLGACFSGPYLVLNHCCPPPEPPCCSDSFFVCLLSMPASRLSALRPCPCVF